MIASTEIVHTIIIVLEFVVAASDDVFIESPQSVNAIHGMSVVFNCTVSMADEVTYRVNDTLILVQQIQGFQEGFISIVNGGSLSRSLTATASVQYNNTDITCVRIIGTSIQFSEAALLLVQGSLSSIVDLSYAFIDSSTVTISWSPPFTLPGTDITGYNISATSNGTTTNYCTSNSYYELSLTDITDSPCNEIIITVSGYNGLDGENTTLTGIYLPSSVTNEGVLDVLPLSQREVEDSVKLSSISINVSSICYGQYPTHINLTIQYSNNGSLLTTIDNIPLVSTNDTDILTTTNDTIILLPVDNNYTAIISFSNLDGVFNFNSTVFFDTHIIRSVSFVISNTISTGSSTTSTSTVPTSTVPIIASSNASFTIHTTITTTTTTTTDVSLIISSSLFDMSVTSSAEMIPVTTSDEGYAIMIVLVVTVSIGVILVLIIIICTMLVLMYTRMKKNHQRSGEDVVPVVPNPSYQDPRDIIRQRNTNQDRNIIIDINPSYSHVVSVVR